MKSKGFTKKSQRRSFSGFTLMEMIVVLGSFAILAVISTSTLFVALNNMAKARVTREVRRNGDAALQIMERQLRVAKAITSCSSGEIDFTDQYGYPAKFFCDNSTLSVASQSGLPPPPPPPIFYLTDSTKVNISSVGCAIFTCDTADPKKWVQINFSLESNRNPSSNRPTEKGAATFKSQINIRYE